MTLKILILSCICFLSFEATSQTVHLSRLQRAAGAGRVPYTDANGKQGYTLLSTLLTDYITGTGTANTIPLWTGTKVAGNSIITQSGSSIFVSGWFIDATAISRSGAVTGAPQLYNVAGGFWHNFKNDENTGMRWGGADILHLQAGSSGTAMIRIDGNTDLVYFDPDANGTDDVTISPTLTNIAGGVRIGTYTSSPTSSGLLGRADNNDVSSITIGSGLTLTSNTLAATSTTLTAGTNILIAGDSISASIKWPQWDGGISFASSGIRQALTTTIDTCQWRNSVGTMSMDVHISEGITFDSLAWSDFPGWVFSENGTHEVTYQFYENGSNNAANRRINMEWYINGTGFDAFNDNHVRTYYNETADRSFVSHSFQLTVAGGQFLQMGAKLNTGTSAMDMQGFRLQIKKIRD